MPLIKDIAFRSETAPAGAQPFTLTINADASGAAGYFTSSTSGSSKYVAGGATSTTPIYMSFTASMNGGTPPYSMSWTSSYAEAGTGYTYLNNRETQSFQYTVYTNQDSKWTVYASDSSTPTQYASASIYSVVAGRDNVGTPETWVATNGSDTPTDLHLIELQGMFYGGFTGPFKTIQAAINYAVPDESRIKLKSGTYAENPVINKKIHSINGAGDNASSSLSASNYFVYGTQEFGGTGIIPSRIFGFLTASYQKIAVNTSGSIQSAIADASYVHSNFNFIAEVQPLGGVHAINSSITTSNSANTRFILNGIPVPTGSNASYVFNPETIIRATGFTGSIFTLYGTGGDVAYKNMALECDFSPHVSGSYAHITTGCNRSFTMEMIRFRFISSSVPREIHSFNVGDGINAYASSQSLWRFGAPGIGATNVFYRYIFDNADNNILVQSGNGYANLSHYTLYGSKITPSFVFVGHDAEIVSYNGYAVGRFYQSGINADLVGGSLSTQRAFFQFNPSNLGDIFQGMPHTFHPGTARGWYEASAYMPYTNTASSACAFAVFQTATSSLVDSTTRRVVAKWGDLNTGWSIVTTGSKAITSLYAIANGATQSVVLEGNIQSGSPYLAEFFFDSSSINKRVGMALYSSSSLVTSSYFGESEFSVSALLLPSGVTAIGSGTGQYRTKEYIKTTTAGRQDHYAGRIAEVLMFTNSGSATNLRCKNIYDYLRFKYFPTSSIVSRSIFSDTDNFSIN